MKNNEKPDILSKIKGIKLRRELTVLLAFFVMLSTSYVMIHPSEALNNSTARSFMFFNEEDGVTEETAVPTEVPDMNALLDADRDSGAVEEAPAEETPAEEVQNEETASAVTEEVTSEPAGTPAETVVPTLEPTSTPENIAEATGTPEALESANPEETAEAENTSDPFSTASTEPVIEETSTPEATASASPEPSASAAPEATASAEPTATPEAEEEEYPAFSEENIVPLEEDGTETEENIRVFIKAAEGTFPEGTTVKVVLVRDTKVLEAIEQAAVEKAKEEDKDVKVNQVQAVDITFTDKDGNEIQPLKPIAVSFKSELVKKAENTTVVHVEQDENKEKITDTKTVDTIAKPEDSDLVDSIEDNEVVIEADSFSVYGIVGTEEITTEYISHDGTKYDVIVTYGPSAKIPEGSTLSVTDIEEETEEYNYARNAVLADKKEKGEYVDIENFKLAALDISILDPYGNEIEPEDTVQVDIKIKELPGVDNLTEIKDTLEIQHHVEVTDGVVIEKVFDGDVKGAYEMDTNDKIAAAGTVVDPSSVSDADFITPEDSNLTTSTESMEYEHDVTDEEMGINTSFVTPVFSTFTITWGGGAATNTTTTLRWRNGNNNSNRATLTVNYVDQNGTPITRPSTIGYTVDKTLSNNSTVSFEMTELNDSISGFTYVGAYRDSNRTVSITEVSGTRTSGSNTFTFYNGSGVVETSTSSNLGDIYLVYNGTTTQPHTTIHYGYMDGTTFVEFEDEPSPVAWQTGHHTYLIYDFDGYQYEGHTYYRTTEAVNGANMTNGATSIRESLAHNNANGWRYRAKNSNNWSSIADGSHIYVVYSKNPDTPTGGTPKTKPVNPEDEPDDPSILKESVPNGDGTSNLSLSVRGSTVDLEVEKLADVIVVFDVSGSMAYDMDGNTTSNDSRRRITIAKNAVNNLVDTLAAKKDSAGNPLIRMSLISFATSASNEIGLTDLNAQGVIDYKDAVDDLTTGGGTNWEKALKLADEMSVDSERATFVIFVTDGNPTFRVSRMNVTDAQLQGDLNSWDNNDTYYWSDNVFGTGNSDNALDGTSHGRNYRAALSVGESIVSNNKNFYTIGISNDVTNLDSFADDSGAAGHYTATSSSELEQAFDDIATSIQAKMGFGDINMTDGITDLSNTVMESASLLGVDDDFTYWKAPAPANWSTMTTEQKAAYKPADSAFVEWDPSTERCQAASYNEQTGAVEWHMGPNFVPEDGCTYKVTFSVWPSQDAYDWIADLKNGTKTWADVRAEGLDYPNGDNPQIVNNGDGSYSLATNKPGANTTYKSATKSGDTVTTTGNPTVLNFNSVDPVALAEKQMTVRKRFAHSINSVSPLTKIQFTLLEDTIAYKKADGSDYTLVLPTVDGAQPDDLDKWEEDVYIAPGLIKTTTAEPGYLVLEKGHDYSLTEDIISGDAYEYTFTPQIVRPMVVGTTLKYFVKKDTEYNTNPDAKPEYTIDGGTYYELDDDAQALTGTNRKTAELDITKIIDDATGKMTKEQLAAETFTYKITLTVPDGADKSGIMGYEYVPRPNDSVPGTPDRPRFYIFGYQDGDEGASPFTEDTSNFRGKVYGGWNAQVYNLFGDSNTVTFYMTLDNDEMIRLTNLPQGTTYTITEYYANVNRSDQGAPTPSSDRTPNVASQGYTVSVKQDGSPNAVQTDTITGTITELDKRYYNQFTNTIGKHIDVELKARKHLNGYVWSNEQYFINLTTDDGNQLPGPTGRTRFYRQFAAGSAGDVDQNGYTFGKIRFTEPGTYKYYIAEDNAGETIDGIIYDDSKTVTIVIAEDNATHELYVDSVTGADTTWDADTLTSMTTITNSRVIAKVKVLKIGDSQTTNTLSDVSFELYSTYIDPDSDQNVKAKKADGTEYGTLTTGADGTFTIDGLIPSTDGTVYYLVETVAKPGYNLLTSPVKIKVYLKEDAPYYEVSYEQSDYSASIGAGRIQPDEEGNCMIVVDNKSGVVLPMTGGPGTFLYTLSGFALMMASALMYGFRMRRRERRLN